MKYLEYIMLIYGLFLTLYVFIFIKIRNKESKPKFKADLTDLIGIIFFSIMLFIIANPTPPKYHGYPTKGFQKLCFVNQRIIFDTIKMYYEDNKKEIPPVLTTEEINHYLDEVFLKERYLKSKLYFPSIQCKLEMKNNELYCLRHGSTNKESPYYKSNEKENFDSDELSDYYREIKNKRDKEWQETLERAKYLKIVFALTILASIKMLFAYLLS